MVKSEESGAAKYHLWDDNPVTDPVMWPLAHRMLPDVMLPNGANMSSASEREQLRQYGGAVLQYLSEHQLIDLDKVQEHVTQTRSEGEA